VLISVNRLTKPKATTFIDTPRNMLFLFAKLFHQPSYPSENYSIKLYSGTVSV
jgi:hypothetical protein